MKSGNGNDPKIEIANVTNELKSILNKLSEEENLGHMDDEVRVKNQWILKIVMDMTFDMAMDEPFYVKVFSQLCYEIQTLEVGNAKENTVIHFKAGILQWCRDAYEKNCTDKLAFWEKRNKTYDLSLK